MVVTLEPYGTSGSVVLKKRLQRFSSSSPVSSTKCRSTQSRKIAGGESPKPHLPSTLLNASISSQYTAAETSHTVLDRPGTTVIRSSTIDVSHRTTIVLASPVPQTVSPCIVQTRDTTALCVVVSTAVVPPPYLPATSSSEDPNGIQSIDQGRLGNEATTDTHMTSRPSQHQTEIQPLSKTTIFITHSSYRTQPYRYQTGVSLVSKTTVSTTTSTETLATRFLHSQTRNPHSPTPKSLSHSLSRSSQRSKSITTSNTATFSHQKPSMSPSPLPKHNSSAGKDAVGPEITKIVLSSLFGLIAASFLVYVFLKWIRRRSQRTRRRRTNSIPKGSLPPQLEPDILSYIDRHRDHAVFNPFVSTFVPFPATVDGQRPLPVPHAPPPHIQITSPASVTTLSPLYPPPLPSGPMTLPVPLSRRSSYTTISTASMDSRGQRRLSEPFDLE